MCNAVHLDYVFTRLEAGCNALDQVKQGIVILDIISGSKVHIVHAATFLVMKAWVVEKAKSSVGGCVASLATSIQVG